MKSLSPAAAVLPNDADPNPSYVDRVRLSRSPHPYHRHGSDVHGSDVLPSTSGISLRSDPTRKRPLSSSSDSGTEADDERGTLLKGLPAPPFRLHKGLKGNSPFTQSPGRSPVPTPPAVVDERPSFFWSHVNPRKPQDVAVVNKTKAEVEYVLRKRAEITRRATESALLLITGCGLCYRARSELKAWVPELTAFSMVVALCCAALPFRVTLRLWRQDGNLMQATRRGLHIPSRFDLGLLMYPVVLPVLVALCMTPQDASMLAPNLVLGLSSIPEQMIPLSMGRSGINYLHWAISTLPLAPPRLLRSAPYALKVSTSSTLHVEAAMLLYPLQHTLIALLRDLTTTSLDPAELPLLSTALVNLALFSTSPQMEILTALLWVGGTCIFVTCSQLMSWEVALARIPSWRFRRRKPPSNSVLSALDYQLCQIMVRRRLWSGGNASSDEETSSSTATLSHVSSRRRSSRTAFIQDSDDVPLHRARFSNGDYTNGSISKQQTADRSSNHVTGTNMSTMEKPVRVQSEHAHRSRQRQADLPSAASFLSFSPAQAQVRRWLYASTVFALVLVIILIPVRRYVSTNALHLYEPFGWALGYLFGNINAFRFFVVSNNLDYWIRIPPRVDPTSSSCTLGWIERLRQIDFGPASTRLILCVYCLIVLFTGIATVLRLTSVADVDTRRKVFHGVMVAMLLPTIFVDPCFISLALVLILAIFLLLDLCRASQLPPISRPLTHFLAPYVDGRDHRGPVIVSPIFLLSGCAIPLWLSLAEISRTGTVPWIGWDVATRDISMVSGVVCVGMGDAAASLVGRRYGKTKWLWSGGKSLEGSAAFTLAVTCGLCLSWCWLRFGGWVASDHGRDKNLWSFWFLATVLGKCFVAGLGASLLEATLTAANDNVVVPVGLWLMVRALRI